MQPKKYAIKTYITKELQRVTKEAVSRNATMVKII